MVTDDKQPFHRVLEQALMIRGLTLQEAEKIVMDACYKATDDLLEGRVRNLQETQAAFVEHTAKLAGIEIDPATLESFKEFMRTREL